MKISTAFDMRYEYLSIIAAFTFGLSHVLMRMAMKNTTPVTATISVAAVQVVILSSILVFIPPKINGIAIIYFILAGFLAVIMGRTMNYTSIDKLGVPISTSLVGTNPLFAMIMSVLFLGEKISVSAIIGLFLVVLGVFLISGWGKDGEHESSDMVIPLAAAFFYGASSVVRKAGLNILPESVLGAVVGASTGLVFYPIILRFTGRTGEFSLTRKAVPSLVMGGVAVSIAWICMFMATQLGSVGVVSAIIGSNPLFGLILSALLLKDTEKISVQVVLGSICIVFAVMLITLF